MRTRLTLTLALAIALGGCGGHDDHQGDDHATEHAHDEHVHSAPRGGALIVLAEETAHLELLFDAATGAIDLYALGPHAAQPVRLATPSITLHLDIAGQAIELALAPVASTLTGETPGDTSQFQGHDERLVGATSFTGTIERVDARGTTYENVPIRWPPP